MKGALFFDVEAEMTEKTKGVVKSIKRLAF